MALKVIKTWMHDSTIFTKVILFHILQHCSYVYKIDNNRYINLSMYVCSSIHPFIQIKTGLSVIQLSLPSVLELQYVFEHIMEICRAKRFLVLWNAVICKYKAILNKHKRCKKKKLWHDFNLGDLTGTTCASLISFTF